MFFIFNKRLLIFPPVLWLIGLSVSTDLFFKDLYLHLRRRKISDPKRVTALSQLFLYSAEKLANNTKKESIRQGDRTMFKMFKSTLGKLVKMKQIFNLSVLAIKGRKNLNKFNLKLNLN